MQKFVMGVGGGLLALSLMVGCGGKNQSTIVSTAGHGPGGAATGISTANAPTFATPPAILQTPVKVASPVASPGAGTPVALGQAVKAGNLTLTVRGSFKPDIAVSGNAPTAGSGAHVPPAPPGQMYLGVAFALQNTGSQPITFTGLPPMSVTDSGGKTYPTDALATSAALAQEVTPAATPIAANTLQPGQTIQSAVGFVVPENASGLTFIFDASSYGDGTIRVPLK